MSLGHLCPLLLTLFLYLLLVCPFPLLQFVLLRLFIIYSRHLPHPLIILFACFVHYICPSTVIVLSVQTALSLWTGRVGRSIHKLNQLLEQKDVPHHLVCPVSCVSCLSCPSSQKINIDQGAPSLFIMISPSCSSCPSFPSCPFYLLNLSHFGMIRL